MIRIMVVGFRLGNHLRLLASCSQMSNDQPASVSLFRLLHVAKHGTLSHSCPSMSSQPSSDLVLPMTYQSIDVL